MDLVCYGFTTVNKYYRNNCDNAIDPCGGTYTLGIRMLAFS